MLQNKIYQNFFIEIIKTFLVILFGLSIIALTVRAVNFLDLIVDNGYPISVYFLYSFLNLFGIAPKFIPFAFLLSLTIFMIKHIQDSEFIILWTSGVKKIQLVNLFSFISILILIFYLILSTFLTPLALNKSRHLLSEDQLNSFLPTIRTHQFSDSFKGFTFIVEKKIGNELKNIFLHDKGNNLKNLSSNISDASSTTIVAQNGIVDKKKLFLFNGQIISSKKNNSENEIIKFEQLNIDLSNLSTSQIKQPKLQETSTLSLVNCFKTGNFKNQICREDLKKEIIPTLTRRAILPFYIPVISLICSLLLIKSKKKYFNKISIFIYSFSLLVFTELAVRYTGINYLMRSFFIISPFALFFIFYFFLIYKFSRESKSI
jgi:lipopolysaccharide export LptBFGC system permease protein LptF